MTIKEKLRSKNHEKITSEPKVCIPSVSSNTRLREVEGSFECPICKEKGISISFNEVFKEWYAHCRECHVLDKNNAYALIIYGGWPVCKCGCGSHTKLQSTLHFGEYKAGHRIRDIQIRTEEGTKKAHDTQKKMYENGELKGWMAGKSAATDERVAALQAKNKKWRDENPELSKSIKQENMKICRESGYDPSGENHGMWKGGVSTIAQLAHANLYSIWKKPHLQKSGFKCENCQKQNELTVHHNEKRFATISQEAMSNLNMRSIDKNNFEQKNAVVKEIIRIHVDEKISGIVLCGDCHVAEHRKLGESCEGILSIIRRNK